MHIPPSTTARPCGIIYVLPDLSEAYLPLEKADIHADVVDVSAIVTITQHFWQYSSNGLQRAKYVFPVPARAAVCGFEMTTEDGAVITAIAKEKGEAKREHEQAISQGYMTGLVEHVTDDIFSISLGALPGRQMIQAKITYVLDLMDEDVSDQVRLQIPVHVGMRFGNLPEGMRGAHQVPPHRISVSADVWMQGAVKNVTSPTHPAVIVSDSRVAHTSRNARYISTDFLTRDFVLSITAQGLDAPRCFSQKAKNGSTAIQLNIVPRFNLPSITKQEYIFLVDRSGSMEGDRIETAKKTLVMLLRALPSQGTHFNIFSFGSHCDSLWPQSAQYDEHTLDVATRHVDTMDANYGGTEIQSALQQVFFSRKTDTPTACFVLTDGETYNIDHTISTVEQAVKQVAPFAPLRVFTLGIGNTTSIAMCEGIARAGNGICLMATTSEGIIGKCSKLVRASRTYILKNVSIDWGVRTDLAEAYRTGNTNLKSVRQAPAQISAIYPGNRFIVFALIDDQNYTPPNEVVIRAQRDGQGEVLQFSVPIQVVEFLSGHPHGRLIPTLAARRAIMDLDDGNRGLLSPDIKAAVVKLGTEYQLASRYTSFVAVNKRTNAEVVQEQPREAPREYEPMPAVQHRGLFAQGIATVPASGISASHPPSGSGPFGLRAGSANLFGSNTVRASAYSAAPAPASSGGRGVRLFGMLPQASSPPQAQSAPQNLTSFPPGAGLFGSAPSQPAQSKSTQVFDTMSFFTASSTLTGAEAYSYDESSSLSTEDKVLKLVRLQSFDGSFPATASLENIIGKPCLSEAARLQVDQKVWATVLAISFLKNHMKDQPELLDGLVEKATDYLTAIPGINIEALLTEAESFVA